MDNIFKKLYKGKMTGIYGYREAFFVTGYFLGMFKKYLILDLYSYFGKREGVAFINSDVVTGVKFFSDYLDSIEKKIKQREKVEKVIYLKSKDFFRDLFDEIIRRKIIMEIKLDDENWRGYLIGMDKERFYFDFVDYSLGKCSSEIVRKDYFNLKMEITRDGLKDITIDDRKYERKNVLLEIGYGKWHSGDIIFQDEEYTLFLEKMRFNEDSKLSVIRTEYISEEKKNMSSIRTETIDDRVLFKDIEKMGIVAILNKCMKSRVAISIFHRDFSKKRTGIILKVGSDKFSMREVRYDEGFMGVYENSIQGIEMLHIENYSIIY